MQFPQVRPRRLRKNAAIRNLVASTDLSSSLIYPLFVREKLSEPRQIKSMPGIYQNSYVSAVEEVKEALGLGISAFMIFGIPDENNKDELGRHAYSSSAPTQVALSKLRDNFGDEVVLFSDLCIDDFTTHGHCGAVDDKKRVDNDKTLEIYRQIALSQAKAGADFICPSGMMDGQVGAIREVLDENGFAETGILSYGAKYSSSLYGPFREAVNTSLLKSESRDTYQQDYRRSYKEALLEIRLDIAEGADMVMVKPASFYLDIISHVKKEIVQPVAAYQVSGEYAMIKFGASLGCLNQERLIAESLYSIRRAGADIIITYFAKEFLRNI